MIVLVFLVVGAVIGGVTARRRAGNRLDIAQYAAVYAIGFALLGLVLTIVIERSLT